MNEAYQSFREALLTEILRRVRQEKNFHMTREEAEYIGVQAGLPPGTATTAFLDLEGDVWIGETSRSEESKNPWDVAHFDIPWYQDQGLLPIPLE